MSDSKIRSGGSWAAVALVLLLVLGIEQILEHFSRQHHRQIKEVLVLNHLSAVRARLEGIINSNLHALQGLTAVIAVNPDIDQQVFSSIARELVDSRHALRNIAGAPDLVVSLMYPMQGNEKVIGLDYRTHPTQSQAAMRAIEEQNMILAGPLELIQGGRGVIARAPVFTGQDNASDPRRLWGLVASVIDADMLFRNAGLHDTNSPARIAIRGVDGTGINGSVFFGDPELFNQSPVNLEVTLPNGSWYMAAVPVNGWHVAGPLTMAVRFFSFLIALLAGTAMYFSSRNAAERQLSEKAVAEQESILDSVFQSLPDIYFRMADDGTILDYRAQRNSDLYVPPETFLGRRMQDVLPPDLGAMFQEKSDLVKKTGGIETYEYDIPITDGLCHFEARLSRLEKVNQLVAVVRNVDEQYRARMALKQREENYRGLFESTGTAMCLITSDGTLSLVNHTFAKLTGKSKAILEGGVKFIDLVYPDDRESVIQHQKNLQSPATITSPPAFEFRYCNDLGDTGWGLALITLVPGSGESIASIIDITSRKYVERDLQRELDEKRQILGTTMDGYILADSRGNLLDVNAAYSEIVGFTRQELIGMNIRQLEAQMSDDDIELMIQQMVDAEHSLFETRHNLKSGGTADLEVSASVMSSTNGPLVIAFVRDITTRKMTEEVLNRSQKMDAIGKLTGGIAHDFNNILGIIIGNLELLKPLISMNDKALMRVETVNKAALRAADLTRQLLGFSRQDAQNTVSMNINQAIRDMESLITRSVTPEVELELRLDSGLWQTTIDPGDFQDAMLNLILNARDAMPDGGQLILETANKYLDAASLPPTVSLEAGEYVELVIRDTGIGIPADNMEHIFDPFYTTKPQGKGTGLGLSMVFGFVERSKGYIKAYSELEQGAEIRIYLPRSTEQKNSPQSRYRADSKLPTGNETVLIVDDEEDLLELAESYLAELGYNTMTAKNGKDALKCFTESLSIDLVFSDVVMPGGMNGYELESQLRMLKPEIKVLLTSGFTKKGTTEDARQPGLELLSKPYSKSELAYRIRQVLEGIH